MRLDAQIQFAVASDQRSLVLAAISVALAGVLVSMFDKAADLFWLTGATILFSISALFASLAAFPQEMKVKGSKYGRLKNLIDDGEEFLNVIAGLSEENDEAIAENAGKAEIRAHLYRLAVVFFAIGVCLAVWVVTTEASARPL